MDPITAKIEKRVRALLEKAGVNSDSESCVPLDLRHIARTEVFPCFLISPDLTGVPTRKKNRVDLNLDLTEIMKSEACKSVRLLDCSEYDLTEGGSTFLYRGPCLHVGMLMDVEGATRPRQVMLMFFADAAQESTEPMRN